MNRSLNPLWRKRLASIFCSILFTAFFLLGIVCQLNAAISSTGNISPSLPWTFTTIGYIGKSSDGSLIVDGGSQFSTGDIYIGNTYGVKGSAIVTGASSKWSINSTIFVGRSGSGMLSIEAGGQVVSGFKGYLGYDVGSTGTATIAGNGSTWTNSNQLYVGQSGNGTLIIQAGGKVSNSTGYLGCNSSSTGTATIAGNGSTWTNSYALYVGQSGNGTLTIQEGGKVSNTSGYLGYNSGSTGTATVTGAGSVWNNNGDLYVGGDLNAGKSGSGTLTVADGGEVTANTFWASLSDLHGNGTITVTQGAILDANLRFDSAHGTQTSVEFGSGGTLKVNANGGKLGVGYKGTGSLTVSDGIAISSSYGYLGYNAGSIGSATITGVGSKWINSGSLSVGRSGNGTLTVADGGEVTTATLLASLKDLHGNGIITATQGAILDAELRFDATHGTQATVAFDSGGTLKVNAAGGDLGVGYKETGCLIVADGIAISGNRGFLGTNSGATGTATVTGNGSKWTSTKELYVGSYGSGMLSIQKGGEVSNTLGYIGNNSGSTGTVIISDIGSKWTNTGDLYVGSLGSGTLTIEAGGQVSNTRAYIDSSSGSIGKVTVSGMGSMWTNSDYLSIGLSGSGSLTIDAGGQVSNKTAYIGSYSGSTGTVMVSGGGSKWICGGGLNIGGVDSSVSSTLNIRASGLVSANIVNVYNSSLLSIDAEYGSKLNLTDMDYINTITNNGKVRILAAAGLAAGSQTSPIAATIWDGSGIYQAVGGTWNQTSHKFTVSSTQDGTAGSPVSIDAAQVQRVLVKDSSTGWKVGASFLAKSGTGNNINLTVSVPDEVSMTTLQKMLGIGHSVMSAWNFSAQGAGYSSSDPVYLSFAVGQGLPTSQLEIWRYNGSSWSSFPVSDLTCNDGYASFTSTGLNNYAVSAFLPSPTWNKDADGSWQNGSNWTTSPTAPGGVNTIAILGPMITAPRTVTLNEPLTLGALTLKSSQHYRLTGSEALNLQVYASNTAKIDVQQSDSNGHVIEAPLTLSSPLEIAIAPSTSLTLAGQVQNPTGQTLTISGGGILTVTQGLATTGAINVQAGTLITSSLTAGTLTIGGGATSSIATVPEPSSVFLLLAALTGIAGCCLARLSHQKLR
jgi:T5SS/PEP-CTERM-associated repeat protein